ncbi:MAG: maleylpyruvate isomerase N-terminal domain-containing protein [Dehalococcoidia bacterium]
MDPPVTTQDFLRLVDDAHAEMRAAIAAIPEDTLTTPGTLGEWSARDVIAHVGADEMWMAGQLEALQAGEQPTALSCYGSDEPLPEGADLITQDGRNAWQRERLRGLSLDEVRGKAAEGHARLIAVIESFSDKQLAEELAIANLGTQGWMRRPQAGESGWALWEWLRGVTYHHYADHTEALRALQE